MTMSMRSAARVRTALAVVIAASTVAVLISVPASADTAPPTTGGTSVPATVSADALPTVQVAADGQGEGVVWAQALAGNTVYATGSFDETYPAGQTASAANETARSNLLAYDITTGDLTSFDQSLNAQGLGAAVSPDGKTLYVVGDFTAVGKVTRQHIAAFDTATGALISTFAPAISGDAESVVATNSTVYVGGDFTSVGGVTRTRLAAFAAGTGALLSWAPSADNQVTALALAPDGSRVIVGGRFVTLDGATANGLDAVDPTNGTTSLGFEINGLINDANANGKCGITSLTTDANAVYGTGFSYGCGNFEGRFAADPDTGKAIWIDDCHGDSYDSVALGQVLYSVSHAHDCSAIGSFPDGTPPGGNQRALAETTYATGKDSGPDSYGWEYASEPDASVLHWFPELYPGTVTDQDQAAWSIVGNSNYLALGGEFPTVNGVAQAGLVRFAVRSIAPNKVGPIPAVGLTPSTSSTSNGTVDLSWTTTWDEDNAYLTYQVVRDDTTVATLHETSSFWQLPTMTYTDTGLTPGSSHTYRIRVIDPFGNATSGSSSAPVTVSDSGSPPASNGPMASFTTSCSQATCQMDGSSSTPQGAIASYDWDFGDGKQGTGAVVSHTYATSGTHTVTLTVTDGSGALNATAQNVSTTPAPPSIIASDAFRRTSKDGWGDADTGGTWTNSSSCGPLSVGRSSGYLQTRRASSCEAWLLGVHRPSSDTTAQLTTTTLPKGGVYVSVLGRRLSSGTDVRLQLHLVPNKPVTAQLIARVNGKQTALSRAVPLDVGYKPKKFLRVELQVSGTSSSTTARARVWTGNGDPPSAWTVSGRSSAAGLRHYGSIGFAVSLPKARNPASVTIRAAALAATLVTQ